MPLCEQCHGVFDELHHSEVLDLEVCEDCNPDFECPECGEIIIRDVAAHSVTLRCEVCPDCNTDFVCPRCGEVCREDESVYSETLDRNVCGDCNPDEYCSECSEAFPEDSLSYSYTTGSHVCSVCYEDYQCSECGDYFDRGNAIWHNDEPYCQNCGNEITDDDDRVHNYLYKPDWNYHLIQNGDKRSYNFPVENDVNVFIGMEVEMKYKDASPDTIEDIRERFDRSEEYVFHKEDGSLSHRSDDPGNGVESVSHPCTLEYWMQNEGYWNYIERMRKKGARGDTISCGIHIHICKNDMTHLHRAKLHLFSLTNQNKMETVARRKNSSYAKFIRRTSYYPLSRQITGSCERYSHLNWQNSKTVELRIFKSTLNNETIKAYLQFADAIYNFTKVHTLHECTEVNSWHNFCSWINKKEEYAVLREYLENKRVFMKHKEEDRQWFSHVQSCIGTVN